MQGQQQNALINKIYYGANLKLSKKDEKQLENILEDKENNEKEFAIDNYDTNFIGFIVNNLLTPFDRSIYLLYYCFQKTEKEIAELLRTIQPTIHNRLKRTLAEIKHEYERLKGIQTKPFQKRITKYDAIYYAKIIRTHEFDWVEKTSERAVNINKGNEMPRWPAKSKINRKEEFKETERKICSNCRFNVLNIDKIICRRTRKLVPKELTDTCELWQA